MQQYLYYYKNLTNRNYCVSKTFVLVFQFSNQYLESTEHLTKALSQQIIC